MSVKLSKENFQRLITIVQNLPEFAQERDRRRLIIAALEGVPNSETILARLNLSGAPMMAAIELIKFLADFGQVAYGKEALGVFLNFILPFLKKQDSIFINELFLLYSLDGTVVSDKPISTWYSNDSSKDIHEQIIGENTLRHIYTLQLALDAAKAVAHLNIINSGLQCFFGTGFLIADDLLMTNNHVIKNKNDALQTEYNFNYQLSTEGKLLDVVTINSKENGIFYTNPDLDYTIVQIENSPGIELGYLKLKKNVVHRNDRVAIIQHPGGHLKKISMQNNFITYADNQVLQYITSTLPGSSGSPVFDDMFEVVAIHHSGGIIEDPSTKSYHLRNAGTSMVAIIEDLKKNDTSIYNKLTIKENA